MSRSVSSPQAVLGFTSSSHSFRQKTEATRSASGCMKRGCKRFGEALSVASSPAFVIEKSHTLPRSHGGWNLDPSRAGVINPKNACGDDADSPIETGLCSKKYVIKCAPTLKTDHCGQAAELDGTLPIELLHPRRIRGIEISRAPQVVMFKRRSGCRSLQRLTVEPTFQHRLHTLIGTIAGGDGPCRHRFRRK
jgi:hypothetical protein